MRTPRKIETLDTDYVIVGSGAGGATAAYLLSRAGHHVLVLEEGPRLSPAERPRALLESMTMSMRDAGMQTTAFSHPITVLQGRLVGGSTAINSGIIWRTPEDVRAQWKEDYGLDALTGPRMDLAFEALDRELEVTQTQENILGNNSARMRDAASLLGLEGQPMFRNARTCRGAAQCLQGCPTESRLSMDVSLIPRSEEHGTVVLSEHRAEWISIERGRAVGVQGVATNSDYTHFHARARKGVILSAGAIHTPHLLLKRGFRGRTGHGFQSHPGTAMIGYFDDPVGMSFGATQGYEVPMRDRGYKLESLALPPELLAARIAGAGPVWRERISRLDHYAQWVVQVRMQAQGRVSLGLTGKPRITFRPTAGDYKKLREAIVLLGRMMLRSGASEIHPGVASAPHTLTTETELRKLEERTLKPTDLHLLASHLFGTCAAGSDPARAVVDDALQHHDCAALYVMDASALPTNMGVNPQHTIMAFSWMAAEKIANQTSYHAAA